MILTKGTDADENLTGAGVDDGIVGGGGVDTIDGVGGNDCLFGQVGNDTVAGGPGQDTCAAACTVSGTMTADKATARKLGAKKVATGKGKASEAGTATVTLKPSRSVARKLKKLKAAKVTVRFTVASGGAKKTGSRTLTIRR